MSQAGDIDIVGNNPDIPTTFTTDSGNALPVLNVLEILGTGTITTSGSGNTVTIAYTGTQILPLVNIDDTDSPYTALSTDYFINSDASSGTVTVLLPDAPSTGRTFVVKDAMGNSETNNITVTTVGGAVLIDGATSFTIDTDYESSDFIFDGTAYSVF